MRRFPPAGSDCLYLPGMVFKIWSLAVVVLFLLCFEGIGEEMSTVKLIPHTRKANLVGFTRPFKTQTVAGEVSGRCIAVAVEVGDPVPPSGLVAELDPTFVKIDLAKNRVAQEQAARQMEQEQKNLDRYTNLMSKKSAAQATYDEVFLKAEVYRLTLENLKIEEQRLSDLLARHHLYGQLGWRTVSRSVEPGEYVMVGQPIVKLGDFRRLLVGYQLTYRELDVLQQLESVFLELPELNKKIVASVHSVSPNYDTNSRKIPVDLVLEPTTAQDSSWFRGGLKTELRLDLPGEKATYLVPDTAVISRYEANWLVTGDGRNVRVILLGRVMDGTMALIAGSGINGAEEYRKFPNTTGESMSDKGAD